MATQTSSNPTLDSILSHIRDLLERIPPPSCREADPSHFTLQDLVSEESAIDGDTATSLATAPVKCLKCDRCKAATRFSSLKRDVVYILGSLDKLSRPQHRLGSFIERLAGQIQRSNNVHSDRDFLFLDEPIFRELISVVTSLKFQLPSSAFCDVHNDDGEPVLHQEQQMDPPVSDGDSAMTSEIDWSSTYDQLHTILKRCLWCFSVFPKNAEIKKRELIYWWIGEGFLGHSLMKPEEVANRVFEALKQRQFIKQVEKKGRGTNRCKLNPSALPFVISKAKAENFFDFDEYGKLTGKFSSTGRVSLLRSVQGFSLQNLDRRMAREVKTLFNVDECRIGIEAETFADMKYLRVLHLGRSNNLVPKELIQLNDTKFMKSLKKMKHLRLLSLQGIASVREVPFLFREFRFPNFVCILPFLESVKSLLILDLRACYALESLPFWIPHLKNLTHLDISECHTLFHMPKGIRRLSNLQVLKGFVVSRRNGCTLHHLQMLKKLERLSMYILRNNFPLPIEVINLANMKRLVKLKMVWRTACVEVQEKGEPVEREEQKEDPVELVREYQVQEIESVPGQEEGDIVVQATGDTMEPEEQEEGPVELVPGCQVQGQEEGDIVVQATGDTIEPEEQEEDVVELVPGCQVQEIVSMPSQEEADIVVQATGDKIEPEELEEDPVELVPGYQVQETASVQVQEEGDIVVQATGDTIEAHQQEQDPLELVAGYRVHQANSVEQATRHRRNWERRNTIHVLKKLEKLDLWCLPQSAALALLAPNKFPRLKKLYIRGSSCQKLYHSNAAEEKWNADTLRLLYLPKLEISKEELNGLFPKMSYLEKLECPGVTFPCNEEGFWKRQDFGQHMDETKSRTNRRSGGAPKQSTG